MRKRHGWEREKDKRNGREKDKRIEEWKREIETGIRMRDTGVEDGEKERRGGERES